MSETLLFDGRVDESVYYAPILDFVQVNKKMDYAHFDASVLHQINLFMLPENYDFEELSMVLDKILALLPSIKRIFAKPISRIDEYSEILPIEAVRSVNNQSMMHVLSHSELWEDVTKEGVQPRKLLTQARKDSYYTYENVVFIYAVEKILAFVEKNIRLLSRILYAERDLNFNLLERDNHLSYFLAIGKLHTGYVREFITERPVVEACLDRLLFIEHTLACRRNSPVFTQCRGFDGVISLKKTNVFRMHRDYHRVYLFLQWLVGQTQRKDASSSRQSAGDGYFYYCQLLSLFSAGHFNFSFAEGREIDFSQLDAEAVFGAWHLRIRTVSVEGIRALEFTVTKNSSYRVILLPTDGISDGKKKLDCLAERFEAEEYLLACADETAKEAIWLSLFSIDSFRRIQQILLRGMIYADASKETCPFCGGRLHVESEGATDGYVCGNCSMYIIRKMCPQLGQPYFASLVKRDGVSCQASRVEPKKGRNLREDREAQMHFRNITEIDEHSDIICPKCGHIHV